MFRVTDRGAVSTAWC